MKQKRILIDLDGVLNIYNGTFEEKHIPEVKNGAREFLEELSKETELYLFTTRNLLCTAKWLIANNLDRYFTDVTNQKLPSFLYIDDRSICFRGNYHKTLEEIRNFKAYWCC